MVLGVVVKAPGVAVVAVLSEVAAAFVLTDPGPVLLILGMKIRKTAKILMIVSPGHGWSSQSPGLPRRGNTQDQSRTRGRNCNTGIFTGCPRKNAR